MRIGIITRKLPPEICGIGDHTLLFAKALESLGHEVLIVAGRGEPAENRMVTDDVWDSAALARVLRYFQKLSLEHLVLQYTPLFFRIAKAGQTGHFASFDGIADSFGKRR